MDNLIIFSAEYLFLLSCAVFAVFFFKLENQKRKKFLLMSLGIFALSFVLSLGARELYDNPRPFVVGNFEPLIEHAPDNGFPSDHSLLVGAIAAALMLWSKRLGLWMWLAAFSVGLSRVYAGIHHLEDVLASFAIALISAGAVYALSYLLERKSDIMSENNNQ